MLLVRCRRGLVEAKKSRESLEELQLDTIHSVQSRAGVGPNSISRPKLVRKYVPAHTSVLITWIRTESWRVNHSQVRHQVHGFVGSCVNIISSHPILILMLWRGPSVLLKLTEMPWYWKAEQYIAQSLPGLPATPPILSSPAKVVDLLPEADRSRQKQAEPRGFY